MIEVQCVEVDEIKSIKCVNETQEGKIMNKYLQIKYTGGDKRIWTGYIKGIRFDKNGNIQGVDVIDF